MSFLRLSPLLLSVTLLGCPIAVAAQPEIQHLTCTRDPQGMMCKVDETQATVILKTTEQSQHSSFSAEQLGAFSNLLIEVIFIGLPIAIVFSVFAHDKRNTARTKQLEQLERIWQQS